jgi:nucleoside-diphosphate-sugar epimerase
VRVVVGDILDSSALERAIAGADVVYHIAALVPISKSARNFARVNVEGTQNVVDACKKLSVKKLVYISSSAVYGAVERLPVTEETPRMPVEAYGASKLEGEHIVERYEAGGGRAVTLRPRTILGGAGRLGIFQILFEWIAESRALYTIGDGSNLFQMVHVSDFVDATIKAALTPEARGSYNIGAGEFKTLREELEALVRHARSTSRIRTINPTLAYTLLLPLDKLGLSPIAPYHYRAFHKTPVFDISKARRELRWEPRYSTARALQESFDWYCAHKDELEQEASAHRKPVKQKVLKLLKWIS